MKYSVVEEKRGEEKKFGNRGERRRDNGHHLGHIYLTATGLSSCLGLANPTLSSGLSMLASFDLAEGGVPLGRSEVGVTSKAGLLTDICVVGGAELNFGCGCGTRIGSSE